MKSVRKLHVCKNLIKSYLDLQWPFFRTRIVCCHINKACCISYQCVHVLWVFMSLKYVLTFSKWTRNLPFWTKTMLPQAPVILWQSSRPEGLPRIWISPSRTVICLVGGGMFENFIQQPGWACAEHPNLSSVANFSSADWHICSGIIQRAAVTFRLI